MTRPTLDLSPVAPVEFRPGEPFGFIYDKSTGRRAIPIDIDRKYRKALLEAAAKAPRALFHFRNALDAGPDRDGAQGAIRYFGNELDLNLKLKLTAQMVDNLEVAMPGFKRWLQVTGFGNDKTMIKGFVKWAEQENAKQVEHILPSVRRVMDG
jgi:hypothetical protein